MFPTQVVTVVYRYRFMSMSVLWQWEEVQTREPHHVGLNVGQHTGYMTLNKLLNLKWVHFSCKVDTYGSRNLNYSIMRIQLIYVKNLEQSLAQNVIYIFDDIIVSSYLIINYNHKYHLQRSLFKCKCMPSYLSIQSVIVCLFCPKYWSFT